MKRTRITEYTYAEIQEMSKRKLNKMLRAEDDSKKWPIRSKFNVTERAIRRVSRKSSDLQGYEYYLAVEQEMVEIVNNERNW